MAWTKETVTQAQCSAGYPRHTLKNLLLAGGAAFPVYDLLRRGRVSDTSQKFFFVGMVGFLLLTWDSSGFHGACSDMYSAQAAQIAAGGGAAL